MPVRDVSRETMTELPARTVSRETSARRARWLVPALAAVALLAVACASPPGPRGWAGARPVRVDSQDIILAAHKNKLSALPKDSSNAMWQFPPPDRDTYLVSQLARDALIDLIDGLDVDEAAKDDLKQRASDLAVQGPTAGALKDAVDATGADADAREQIKDAIDLATKEEKRALTKVRALYGDIGVSPDGQTAFVPAYGGYVFALDTTDGETRWVINTNSVLIGGVAVSDDGATVYFGTQDRRIYAVDAETAAKRWEFKTGGEVWATPAVTSDAIYATSFDGSVYRLDEDGKQRWRFDAGSGIASTPLIDGDALYVGAFNKKLYSINTGDGSRNWSFSASNWFWGDALIDDGVVYAGNLDGTVYAIDAATGEKKWDRAAGAPVRSTPVIAHDALIVAARDGSVRKLALADGMPQGTTLELGVTVEADLARDDAQNVYMIPRSANLFVIEAEGDLASSTFPLPR